MVIKNTAPSRYTIAEAAKVSGLTPHVLRVWEQRYGWPRPTRDPHNGYRVYRRTDVEKATKIAAYIHDGWAVGHLLRHGRPVWPRKNAKPPKNPHGWRAKLASVENPKSLSDPSVKALLVEAANAVETVDKNISTEYVAPHSYDDLVKRLRAAAGEAPRIANAVESEECTRCGAEGGDPLICDACSATFCSKCDTGGKCPSCGETLP